MTGINVKGRDILINQPYNKILINYAVRNSLIKIWNLENTIKNLTDQVKVLQKQNDAMKSDVQVASKTGPGSYRTLVLDGQHRRP